MNHLTSREGKSSVVIRELERERDGRERDRERRRKQRDLENEPETHNLDNGRRGETQRRIEDLQDALLLEHSTYDNVEEVGRVVDVNNVLEDVHFERELMNEFEELNQEILGDIEEELRRREMGLGATEITELERERRQICDSEFAIDEIDNDVDMEHLLEDRERKILTIAGEIQEIEDEQEREFNVREPDIQEIERCLMRVQELEEREQEINDIEEEIQQIERGRDQERESERHRNDSLLTSRGLDDIEIEVDIASDGNLSTDRSAIDQVTVVLDQIGRLVERRRRDNRRRLLEEGGRAQRVALELDHIERLVERESGGEGCEELETELT